MCEDEAWGGLCVWGSVGRPSSQGERLLHKYRDRLSTQQYLTPGGSSGMDAAAWEVYWSCCLVLCHGGTPQPACCAVSSSVPSQVMEATDQRAVVRDLVGQHSQTACDRETVRGAFLLHSSCMQDYPWRIVAARCVEGRRGAGAVCGWVQRAHSSAVRRLAVSSCSLYESDRSRGQSVQSWQMAAGHYGHCHAGV